MDMYLEISTESRYLSIGTTIDEELYSIQLNFINNNWNYGVVVVHPYIDEPITKMVDYDDKISIVFYYEEFEYSIDISISKENYMIRYKENAYERN